MFYLFIDNEQRGPYSLEQLAEMGITPETEVWTEGMADWKQAGDVPQLTALLQRLEYERATQRPPVVPPSHAQVPPVPPAWDTQASASQPQSQPEPKRKGSSGTKWLVALLILLVILGVMVVTVPDREAHRNAIMGSTREWVNEKVEQRDMGDIVGEVIKWMSGKGADIAIDQVLQVDNHFVYSVGKLMVGDKPKTISLGILGHVFTFGKDDIDHALRRAMGMPEPSEEPSVGITPPPASEPTEPEVAPDDTLGSVMPREDDEPYDPAQAMLDSLARKAKEEAVRMAKEWAKKQIDNL